MSTASNSLDPQVLPPTPESFWAEYKERIKEEGTWEAYHAKKSTTPWTVVIERATLKTLEKFGKLAVREVHVQAERKSCRLDFYLRTGSNIQIAVEHENDNTWFHEKQELYTLTHVVCDLRVLVAYQLRGDRLPKDLLNEYLDRHREDMMRDCKSKWLFIFGPHYSNRHHDAPWRTYTLDESGNLLELSDPAPLRNTHLRDN
jgi:hypothetical protein